MQAIILAGGQGTRLRPLTLEIPKPVVPLVNRPFLAYQVELLERVGFEEVTLSLNYQPDRIREVMERHDGGARMRYCVEDRPLGTGGAVRYAAKPDGGAVVVFNGDILNDLDLQAVLDFHKQKKAGVTIVLTEVEDPSSYGLVLTDADGRVRQFLEKPGADEAVGRNINAGTYVIEPEYLELMKPGQHLSIEREFFPLLVERGDPFFAYVHRGYWIDIGTVAKYLRAHGDFFKRGEKLPASYSQERPLVWTAPGARVAADVTAAGPLVVGENSEVGAGTAAHRFNVIGRDCVVGPGAHLDGCVLWDGVRVGAGARLKGCVIGERSVVGDNVRLNGLFALGSDTRLPDYSHHTELDGVFGDE